MRKKSWVFGSLAEYPTLFLLEHAARNLSESCLRRVGKDKMRCPYLRTGKSPLADMYGEKGFHHRYVQFQPHLFARSSIPKQKRSHDPNVICDGSPSRIRMVRRISLGMTTRPRSSMRRTIPVAFIVDSSRAFLGKHG